MRPTTIPLLLFSLLTPLALLSTTWLYLLYPYLHSCAFPNPTAPFRLLALGDPQLEGDSSLPDPNARVFSSLEYVIQDIQYASSIPAKLNVLRDAAKGVKKDSWVWLKGKRKAIDLWGNDRYLAHIVKMTRWWSGPTHVAVLGDLLGSQWVTDGEFEKRGRRYWGVVMGGMEEVPRKVFGEVEEAHKEDAVQRHYEEGEEDAGDITNANVDAIGEEESRDQVEPVFEGSAAETLDEVVAENPEGLIAEDPEKTATEGLEDIVAQDDAVEIEHDTDKNKEAISDKVEQDDADKVEEADSDDTEHETDNSEDQDEGEQDTHEATELPQADEHKPLRKPLWGGTTEVLGADKQWAKRVINIAGNHDVGYAGDLDVGRVTRFEKAFGSVNWDIWFTLPSDPNATESSDTPPALRIVILNSMNIDAPAWNHELQTETYSFMNHIITSSRPVEDKTHATVLLTHIPLEKEPGICVDSPFFDYFGEGSGIKEQNMLSEHSSKTVLQGMFGMSDNQFAAGKGMGRRGIVLNGHDHEGCDVMHFVRQQGVYDGCPVDTVKREEAHWPPPPPPSTPTPPAPIPFTMETSPANPLTADDQTSLAPPPRDPPPLPPEPRTWRAHRFPNRPYSITRDPVSNVSSCTSIESSPHIREITLRSMMGDYSGHAGFLSAYFDHKKGERGEWVFEFASCGVGVQHWWWAVHIIDFSWVVMLLLSGILWGVEKISATKETHRRRIDGNVKMNGHEKKM
jgi:hypothetical protein